MDTTEQTKAIRALEESERHYRQLLETVGEGVWIIDAEHKTAFINATFTKIMGYTAPEMCGRSVFEFIPPEVRPAVKARLENHARGASGQAQFWLRRKDGTPVNVILNGNPSMDHNGQPSGVLVMVTDLTEHKRAEETTARLAAIVESSGDSIIATSLDGIITDWNAGATRLYGYEPAEAIGQHVSMLASSEAQKKEMLTEAATLLTTGGILQTRTERQRKDGTRVKISMRVSPISRRGEIIGLSGIAHDITEEERMEEALRRSEERFQLAVLASRDVVWDWDILKDRVWWSERFWEQFGYAPDSFPAGGKGWAGLVHPDDGWVIGRPWDTGAYEYRMRRADGSWAYVRDRASVIRNAAGDRIRMIGCLTDISEAREAEEALRTSEERYRLLFERSLAGVFCSSLEGEILECNEAYWRMLGFSSRDELCRMNLRDLYVDSKTHESSVHLLLERGQLINHEILLRRRDGKSITALSNVTLIPGKQGQSPIIQGTALDISQIRQLQQELLQSQKMEAVGRLAGGVAHDFNNLLMVISSYSELLLQFLTEDRERRYAEQVLKAALRASDLTGRLLAFSRKQTTTPRVLDLNSVVRDIEKMLPRLIGEDIRLVTALDEDLAPCRADSTHIQQVILNLVVNARDAMPNGGRLLIETANVRLDSENTSGHSQAAPGDYVMLAVSDSGIGMDQETQARLFEPFFTTKEVGKGTGLGLSTVYGIVKQNGGFVSVYSELDHGATFKIYFPSLDERCPEMAGEPVQAEMPAGTGTILLVEDESALREAAAEFLRSAGYSVLDVGDGEEALRVAADYPDTIDILLTDVIMPTLGGPELGRQIQVLRPDIRVLYMSGYTENAALQDPATKLPGHFLQKPFSFRILSAKVKELLKEQPTAQRSS